MRSIDAHTQLCAVIGNPVEHSLSPLIHNTAFETAGVNYVYVAFRVEDVGGCLAGMRALPGFRGMSVTIPHKLAVMEHLDEIDPLARQVGCVNTIVNEDGRLVGLTTDGPGTLRAFRDNRIDLEGRRILFLGSGGAVRAVAFAVALEVPGAEITLLGRTAAHVEGLAGDIRAGSAAAVNAGSLDADLRDAMATHDIVIQGTPLGMHPHPDATAVPREWFRPEQTVFDMVYRPYRTRFIQEAEASGCRTILGVDMLINQAVLQFERWTGVPAPREAMREAVVAELARESR